MMVKTTHIGSLPFKTIHDAIEFNKNFALPVLSTLPLIDDNEFMLQQVLPGIHGYSYKDFQISLEKEFSLQDYKIHFLMEEEFIQNFSDKEIKWQIVGIVTLLKSMNDLTKAIQEQIINWHIKNIVSYHRYLSNHFIKVHLFLDEPMYRDIQDKELLKRFVNKLINEKIQVNLHCCGQINIDSFLGLGIEGLSFDLEQIQQEEMDHLINGMKNIYLGVLNTSTLNLTTDFPINEDYYYTPTCGLAFSDPEKVLNIPKVLSFGTI